MGSILFGSVGSLLLVWSLLDIMLAFIVIPNMIALLLLSEKVKEITVDYFAKRDQSRVKQDEDITTRKLD
ncbi:alanine:cation symporter family protein [Halalkalibacter alkalisediminis]|uniref:Alanine:cation symporter family protein n=1 Tax=Halalkalibacter alkalisediminis TaxID=935616 RepID=A0ABV6NC68_9BACI|nr:alanine:cation symporter family protein [Halalkalibacter alkalisediminis]